MSKIKIGIIGTGGISHLHMAGYKQLDNVEVVAVCDINKERVEKYAEQYGVQHIFYDYNEMLQMNELDGVSVCTWNNSHAAASIAALNAGKHVLCEKPMSMSTEEGLAMQKASEQSGKLLMIGFVRRFGSNTEIAKDFIDRGDLGDIYYAKTKCVRRAGNPCGWFADKSRSGGGPLIDLGVHMIDLSRYLMGKPKAVSVYGATFDKLGTRTNIKAVDRYYASDKDGECTVEDFATAMIRFDNGAVLHVEVSFSAHIEKDELTLDLLGTKGGMKFEPKLEIYSEKYDYMTNMTPVFTVPSNDFSAFFNKEMKHFVDCIETGNPCRNPAEDGVELMKILDAVYKSAQIKKEVII